MKKPRQTAESRGGARGHRRSDEPGQEGDDWVRLERFLTLGSEGGAYFASERKLSVQSTQATLRCIRGDSGVGAVERIVEISTSGRAPRNRPALFALALASKLGDEATRAAAYRALPAVARTGAHLFRFARDVKSLGGLGGSGFKRALKRWYLNQDPEQLAFQAVAHQSRDGWSHRDLLRLSHPGASGDHQAIFKWIVNGQRGSADIEQVPRSLRIIWAYEQIRATSSTTEAVELITAHELPPACVPEALKELPAVWEALLRRMPVDALLRNLGRMTAVGLLGEASGATRQVEQILADPAQLSRARMHPASLLAGLKSYQRGRSVEGDRTWSPAGRILEAMARAFYSSFDLVEPTGKRLCLALDVSGSMVASVPGSPATTCREVAAAMALVAATVEPRCCIVAFTSGDEGQLRRQLRSKCRGNVKFPSAGYWSFGITPLPVTPRRRLDDVLRMTASLPFGGIDPALPIRWALKTRTEIDCFIVYTDSESWDGEVSVDQALEAYRLETGIQARLAVVALGADRSSPAPREKNADQLDVVGFDATAPGVLRDFISR